MPDVPLFDDWVKTTTPRSPRERVHKVAAQASIPTDLADDYLRVTRVESGHRADVRDSPKGAKGFGQVMPDRPGATTRTIGGRRYDLRDPDENVEAGLRLFQAGGSDPVARRLEYFGGAGARRQYERTGRIPNISDGQMTAEQYVRATGGYSQQPTAPQPVPRFDDWAKSQQPSQPSEQVSPLVVRRRATPVSAPPAPIRPAYRTPFAPAAPSQQIVIRQGVQDFERVPARQRQEEDTRKQVEREYRGRRGVYGSPTPSGILHLFANPIDSFLGLARSDEENIARETRERLRQQAVAAEPEVESIRREYGQMPGPMRSVVAPVVGRGGGGLLKVAGGIANVFGIAPNRLGDWANKRGEIIETASALPPLAEERNLSSLITGETQLKEVERDVPEKIATGLVDLGVGLGQIILLKKATRLPFNQLLALEAAAKNSDKPISEQVSRAAEGYALGTALESHLGRGASAALFGVPTAAQTGYEVAQGRMSPLDAAIQTGIQAGAGAILGGSRRRPVEMQPRVTEETPTQRRTAQIEATEADREAIRAELRLAERPHEQAFRERRAVRQEGQPAEVKDLPERSPGDAQPVSEYRLPELRRYFHRDFGEVVESRNQSGTSKGRVRVTAEDGSEHVIKRSAMTGAGNQRAVPIREPAPVESTTSPERERPAVQTETAIPPEQIAAPAPARIESTSEQPPTPTVTVPVTEPPSDIRISKTFDRPGDEYRSLGYDLQTRDAPPLGVELDIKSNGEAWLVIGPKKQGGGVDVTESAPRVNLGSESVLRLRRELQRRHPEIKELHFVRGGTTGGERGRKRVLTVRPTSPKDAAMQTDRAELGLPELEQLPRVRAQEVLNEAQQRNQTSPRATDTLVEQALKGEKNYTNVETMQVNLRAQEVKNRLNAINDEAFKETDPQRLADLRAESDTLLKEFDRISEAQDKAGAEWSRAGTARQRAIAEDYSLVGLIARAKKTKGRDLTPEERSRYEQQAGRITELETQLQQAQVKAQDQRLNTEISRLARQRTRSQTKQSLDTEYAQLLTEFRQVRAEVPRVQASGLAALDPEGKLTRIVLRMARNRVLAGANNAAHLVEGIYNDLRDALPGATERDIRDAISGYSLTLKTQRSNLQAQLAALKSELQSLSKSEDVAAGIRSPRVEGPRLGDAIGRKEGPQLGPRQGPRPREGWRRGAEGPRLTETTERKQGPREREGWRQIEGPHLNEAQGRKEGPRQRPEGPPKRLFTRNATRARQITEQIADLERRIDEQDFTPRPRQQRLPYAKEVQRLEEQLQHTKNKFELEMERASPGHWLRQLSGVRKSWMLSGLSTQAKNIGGTGAYQAFDEVARLPAVIADAAIAPFTNRRTVTANPVAMLDSVVHVATVGLSEAGQIIRKGATREQLERHQFSEIDTGVKVIDFTSNLVFRFMSASDRVFYQYAHQRNLSDRARVQALNEGAGNVRARTKELVANPSEELDAAAKHDALVSTFNNNNLLSNAIKRARAQMGPTANFAIDMVMPFDRTPTNVIARIIEASPVGAGRAAYGLARAAITKSLTAAEQRQFSQTLGRATAGTALMALGWTLADKLLDVEKYQVFLNVGNQRIDLASISPIGNLLALGARLRKDYEKGSVTGAVKTVGGVPLQQPLLKSTTEAVETLSDPERSLTRTGARLASSFIPMGGLARDVGKLIDPEDRRAVTFKQQVQQNLPGLRQRLPVKPRPRKRLQRSGSRPEAGARPQ